MDRRNNTLPSKTNEEAASPGLTSGLNWRRKIVTAAILSSLIIGLGASAVVFFFPEVVFPTNPPARIGVPEVLTFSGQVMGWLSPDAPNLLMSPDGKVKVTVSAGSVDRPLQLSYQPISPEQMPELPLGYVASESTFNLSLADAQGASVEASFEFAKPITVTVQLDPEVVSSAKGLTSNFVIQQYDESTKQWKPLDTTVDLGAFAVQGQADSLSIFALTIRTPKPDLILAAAPTPTVPPTPTSTPLPTATAVPTPTLTHCLRQLLCPRLTPHHCLRQPRCPHLLLPAPGTGYSSTVPRCQL